MITRDYGRYVLDRSDDASGSEVDSSFDFSYFDTFARECIVSSAIITSLESMLYVGSMRCLLAHGIRGPEDFWYADGWARHPVSEWIEEHQDKYDALGVFVCNTGGYELEATCPILYWEESMFLQSSSVLAHHWLKDLGADTDKYLPLTHRAMDVSQFAPPTLYVPESTDLPDFGEAMGAIVKNYL